MIETKTTQPTIGTWDKLSTQEIDRAPKISFEVNIPIVVEFIEDQPREYQGDTGAFYVFDVEVNGEEKAIVTAAWTLLRGLKGLAPLKGKRAEILKTLTKGKQGFEVKQLIG